MPLHDYRCESCGEAFELLLSHQEAREPQACPRCGGTMQKLMSAPAAVSASNGAGTCSARSGFT